MRPYCHFLPAALLLLALQATRPALAAWPADPLVNTPVCVASGDQEFAREVSDGSGGIIVTWFDYRNGAADIYAQRISSSGTPLWTTDGVPVCNASGEQTYPVIATDGAGGAFIAWNDLRTSGVFKLYGQHIDASGAPQWTTDGISLATSSGTQQTPSVIPDGVGGAIVSWMDLHTGTYDLYAQRVSAAGVLQWGAGGAVVCAAAGHQYEPQMISDGAGGAIVAWYDQRTGTSYTVDDIYAQRISDAGVPQWTADGVALCTATGSQQSPSLVSDGVGGAIVTWFDGRSGGYDIYAQRISSAGITEWTTDGVALCTGAGEQAYPSLVADGLGGAIVGWRDYRSGIEYDVYAQHISQAGAPLWPADGIPLCTAAGDQYEPSIVSDGSGGAVLAWTDYRSGAADLYTQRVNGSGTAQWPANGVSLSTAMNMQNVIALLGDGAGGALATWQDKRGGTNLDIYAQRIQGSGVLGGNVSGVPALPSVAFGLERAYPNPAVGGRLNLRFTLPDAAAASIEVLDLAGRRLATREVGPLGKGDHTVTFGAGRRLAPGIYMVRLSRGPDLRAMRVAVLR